MNNQNLFTSSGERLSFFQLFNHKKLQVEIPIIQRDYAQGRENQGAVRTAFLEALNCYLVQGKANRDLDFVYGTVVPSDNKSRQQDDKSIVGRFIPLDGQQRLTTLFLLHWYLGQIAGQSEFIRRVLSTNGRSRFTYETRTSSSEFCDALLANNIDFDILLTNEKNVDSVAATIQDAGWFYLSWSSDPTICSMLTMLDAIHLKFNGKADFFERLVDDENPVITFLYLNLSDFKLTDDLYIKMNARGKPLTHFENFKAKLEKKLKSFEGPWPEYHLAFREGLVTGYEYFIHKIDTDWVDVFWGYRNVASKDNTYDDELMNFIALVMANYHILHDGDERKLFGSGGNLKYLSFEEYDEFGCFDQNSLIHLIEMFDLLHKNGICGGKIKPYLKDTRYFDEGEAFNRVISNTNSYTEKLRFYAFYSALMHGLSSEELLSWMRVVFNLTENIIINTLDAYCRALKAIRDLIETGIHILDLLKTNIEISGFTKDQVVEEKVKAHLITSSPVWKQKIIELEAHPFFKGQIGFVLKFSEIVKYYQKNGNTNWSSDDSDYLNRFIYYSQSASAVFSQIYEGSEKISFAWERAVLAKGEYMTSTTANRYNLLSTRQTKNNIDRDHSWKRLLRTIGVDSYWDEKQQLVKAVLDDSYFNANDVAGSLAVICANAMESVASKDWRKLLIEMPELYSVCNQGFIVKNSDEIVLLHESQRNHLHSELYTKYLELKLRGISIDYRPFNYIGYKPSRALDDYSCLNLKGFNYSNYFYELDIIYESDTYWFRFSSQVGGFSIDCISLLIDDNCFELKSKEMKHEVGILWSKVGETSEEAIDKLVGFCEKLRALK